MKKTESFKTRVIVLIILSTIAVSKIYAGVQSYLQLKRKVVIQKLAINIARQPLKLRDSNVYSFHNKIKMYYYDLLALQFLSTKESPGTKTATIHRYLHHQLVHRTVGPGCPLMGPDLWITNNLGLLLSWLLYKPSSEKGYKEKG